MKEIVAGVIGSVLTGLVFWVAGMVGETAAQIPMPKFAVTAFNLKECPIGWRDYGPARGRYIVGLNEGGHLGRTVGIPLSDQEDRPAGQHDHAYADSTIGGNGKVIAWSKDDADRKDVPRKTDPNEAKAGTNAPYVQLLLCEKV